MPVQGRLGPRPAAAPRNPSTAPRFCGHENRSTVSRCQPTKPRRRPPPTTAWAARPVPTCSSTRTTPCIGGRGDPRRWRKPSGRASRSCCRWAMACHWCHVMAHESFEDEATAAVMNDLFVNIKVDREERPDIDAVYMRALHSLGEQGGWPLTMFLDSDARPFWGGTYFPPTSRYGRPGFTQVLREVARVYAQERDKVAHNAGLLLGALQERERAAATAVVQDEVLADL